MFRRNVVFGNVPGIVNAVRVGKDDLYDPEKGYGFVTEKNRRAQPGLQIAEINSAFNTMEWYQDENLTLIEEDEAGCFMDSDEEIRKLEQELGYPYEGEHRRIPLIFKLDVPRAGNYKVTVTIRAVEEMKNVLFYTGRRRLAIKGDILAGSTYVHTCVVNVSDIIPRGKDQIYGDHSINLAIVADKPRFSMIQVKEISCPTLYIAGDSTLTDQSADYPYAPGTSYSGWGQMLGAFLKDKVALSNHAHSGLTTESFRSEGHLSVVESYIKPRDFLFFQFGHNDQKLKRLQADGGYKANLTRYVAECMEKGAYPVIITPMARNTWTGNGDYNDMLEEFAESCKEVGHMANVPVLDLHGLSRRLVTELGLEEVKKYFYPEDYTHTNDYGAYRMASYVAGEIRRVCSVHPNPGYRFLATCVTEGYGPWEPEEKIVLPRQPKDYQMCTKNVDNLDLGFPEGQDLGEPLNRAQALNMVEKTLRFFPVEVYHDMYDDVVGHEWYAGVVECGYKNGIIPEEVIPGIYFEAEKKVSLEDFILFAMKGYRCRKQFPPESPCAYDKNAHKYALPYLRAACSLGILKQDEGNLDRVLSIREAESICKSLRSAV